MPLGDEKHQLIYQELVNILGSQYVSNDPGVMEVYTRDFYAVSVLRRRSPEFVVLPESTEDVQEIVKKALDPNNVANPTHLINIASMEKATQK